MDGCTQTTAAVVLSSALPKSNVQYRAIWERVIYSGAM